MPARSFASLRMRFISGAFPTDAVHEFPDAAEVHRRIQLERVSMAACELHKCLGRRGGLEQPAPVGQRDHLIGPGEQGEPAGTTSLGYGPLLAGATLEMPLVVTRRAPGSVAFDLQVLAGNDLLTLADGSPAELRVEVP